MAEPDSQYDLAPSSLPIDGDEPAPATGPPPIADEEDEPEARPAQSGPRPVLPRIVRTAPLTVAEANDDEGDPEPKRSRRDRDRDQPARTKATKGSTGRGQDAMANARDDEKGRLVAETPALDTVDSRQRARLLIGGVAVGALLLAVGTMLVPYLPAGTDDDAELFDEGRLATEGVAQATAPAIGPGRGAGEAEAADLLRRAKAASDPAQVRAQLDRIVVTFPQSAAAQEARAAIDRSAAGLPMFANGPVVVAEPPHPAVATTPPTTAPPAQPKAEVVALAPAPTPPSGVADAAITPPAATPEPRAEIGLAPNPDPAPAAPGLGAKLLPAGFRPREGVALHESGWPFEIVADRDGASMVLVAGASFLMGRDDGTSAEAPAHYVTLSPFYIDQHEVTVRQYELFREDSARRGVRLNAPPTELAKVSPTPDHPIVLVSAREAKAYADWAGKALPTEAQWELAARTPDSRPFPWGATAPIWATPREPKQIDKVMSFPTDLSPYGVFDLGGNAWEWTADWYDGAYYRQFRGAPAVNPPGPRDSRTKQLVVKGASKLWIAAHREGMKVDTRLPFLGFRCVLPLPDAPPAAPSVAAPGQPNPAGPSQPAPATGGVVPF